VIAEIWGAYETENIILIKLRISMTLFQIPKIFGEEHFHKKKKLPFCSIFGKQHFQIHSNEAAFYKSPPSWVGGGLSG
jgi:cupin superfamily acireductone dioxygenase involved in methionine salvage